MNKKNMTPCEATHPGELIKDELKERGMTQKQLALETGIKPSVLSETVNGKRSVSLNVAVALEKALGIPADFWMNLQTQYDLDTAQIAERDNQRETIASPPALCLSAIYVTTRQCPSKLSIALTAP
jgi:HTH-type transcriptional regulator/antitoxin HigA